MVEGTAQSAGEANRDSSHSPSIDSPDFLHAFGLLSKVSTLKLDNMNLKAKYANLQVSSHAYSPELRKVVNRLPGVISLLEQRTRLTKERVKAALLTERLRVVKEQLKNSSQPSSIESRELAALKRLPLKVALLEHDNERLQAREEQHQTKEVQHQHELQEMSATFKTALALKNRKIKDLEEEVGRLRELKNGETNGDKSEIAPAVMCGLSFKNISEEHKETLNFYYGHYVSNGFNWRLVARLSRRNGLYLVVILKATEAVGESRYVPAVDISLISRKGPIFNVSKRVERWPANNDRADNVTAYECDNFISIEDLFDEEKGYVKDNSILVNVVFPRAD